MWQRCSAHFCTCLPCTRHLFWWSFALPAQPHPLPISPWSLQNALTRDVFTQLRTISSQQSKIREMKNKLALFRWAVNFRPRSQLRRANAAGGCG